MDTELIKFLYYSQINEQITLSFIALSNLSKSTSEPPNIIFFNIQALLTSCANISKFFCPINEKEAKDRIRNIESIFGFKNGNFERKYPTLCNRETRDNSDHFDERIDYFVKEAANQNKSFAVSCVGSIGTSPCQGGGFYNTNAVYMRHYDNVNGIIYYVGRNTFNTCELSVESLNEELIKLKNHITDKLKDCWFISR